MMNSRRILIGAVSLGVAAALAILVARVQHEPRPAQGSPEGTINTDTVSATESSPNKPVAEPFNQTGSDERQNDDEQVTFSCPEPALAETINTAALAAALQHSDDPEHLLIASLYGGKRRSESSLLPDEHNLDGLFRGLALEPRHELLLWSAMTLCAESNEQDRCNEFGIPELATSVLGDNATFWFRLAAIRADAGDMEGAYAALERSVAAPEYKEYFIEHVELFARGIAAFNNAPYNQRVGAGFGMAAAMLGAESDVLLACQQQASDSAKWLHACTAIGERMEAHGRTLMTEMLGLGLQKAMFEIAGDDLRAQAAESRAAARQRFIDEMSEWSIEDEVLMHDERVLDSFIDAWKAGGERQATMSMYMEVRRLMAVPGYTPCDQ